MTLTTEQLDKLTREDLLALVIQWQEIIAMLQAEVAALKKDFFQRSIHLRNRFHLNDPICLSGIVRNCSSNVFIFLCGRYSPHKRFVLRGAGCASHFACKTLVSCNALQTAFFPAI
jgi:hypothetical protein